MDPYWSGDQLWPVTIIRTRYGGGYEGEGWAAFHLDHNEIPEDATGGDPECYAFWMKNKCAWWVAVGKDPDEAYSRLEVRCRMEHARRKGVKELGR
jgi:hypothetical protein